MKSLHLLLVIFSLLSFSQAQAGLKGSLLGFNTGFDQPDATFNAAASTYGATWVRIAEPEWAWQLYEGDYTTFIAQASLAKKHGLKVLAVCLGSPANFSGSKDPSSDKYPPLPQYYPDFANFCAGFVKNGADAVEIWNEPNLDGFWCPNTGGVTLNSSSTFAELVKAVYPVVKAVNPNALVITGGLGTGGDYNATDPTSIAHCALRYAERLLNVSGFAESFDGFGIHPYMFGYGVTPDNGEWGWNMWAELPSFYQVLVKAGVGNKQIWITEVGCPSMFVAETEATQAQIIQQYLDGFDTYRLQNTVSIAALFIYELQDNALFVGTEEGYFGIQRADGSQKPAALIVANWSHSPL